MSDGAGRPYTAEDDRYIVAAAAEGVGFLRDGAGARPERQERSGAVPPAFGASGDYERKPEVANRFDERTLTRPTRRRSFSR